MIKYVALTFTCMLIVLDTPAYGSGKSQKTGKNYQTSPAISAVITLKTAEGKKPAVFPHVNHQANAECDACHKNANFPADKKWDFKQGHAFCMGCHKAKNEGPIKCNGCHE